MRMALGITAALGAIALAGCTAVVPDPVLLPDPSPTATQALPVIEAGTVVATAEFDPAEGATGSMELVATGGDMFELRVSGFSTTLEGDWDILLSPYPLGPDRTCLDRFAFDLGEPVGPEQTLLVGKFDETMGFGDPSFLDGVVLGQFVQADADQHDCVRTIMARAPFAWDIPDMRPGLAVVDSGSTGGARGEVVEANGVLVSYTVAPNDLIDEIAARFGVTVEDLAYLNPGRWPMQAMEGEVLNLDRTNRSGPA